MKLVTSMLYRMRSKSNTIFLKVIYWTNLQEHLTFFKVLSWGLHTFFLATGKCAGGRFQEPLARSLLGLIGSILLAKNLLLHGCLNPREQKEIGWDNVRTIGGWAPAAGVWPGTCGHVARCFDVLILGDRWATESRVPVSLTYHFV